MQIQVFVCNSEQRRISGLFDTFLYPFRHDEQICRLLALAPSRQSTVRLPHRSALIIGLLIAPAAAGPATVQQAAGRVLLATVSDRNNRPTVDVGPDDFVVEEGNDEREVLAVRVADYPVAVLLDNGGDTAAAHRRDQAGRGTVRHPDRPAAGRRRHAGRAGPRSSPTSTTTVSRCSMQIERVAPSASDRGWRRSPR